MDTKDFQPEIFKLFDDQWGILTAGDKDAFNSMTISWGMLGTLWCMPHKGKNVCTVFVNPARYTYGFMEKSDYYTVSFFDNKKYQKALGIMGSKSGRDMDKAKASGLTPKYLEHGVTYEEAEITFVVRKIYRHELQLGQMPADVIEGFYTKGRVPHTMYIGEIIETIR